MTQHRTWYGNEVCSVARTLEIVGERWTMLVVREAFFGVRRFDDFQRNIGCARNILADRLKTLVTHGIVERRQYSERPPRFEYRLTPKGIDLYPAIIALMQWGDKYTTEDRGPAVVLEHKACAHDSVPQFVCSHCGESIDARAMRPKAGPAMDRTG